jgi:hypothetical protein
MAPRRRPFCRLEGGQNRGTRLWMLACVN